MARNDMMYDGRRMPPRNSRGEFTSRGRGRGRGRRGDRGMDYGMYPEMRDGRVIRSYPTIHPQGDYGRGDMNYDMRGGRNRGDMGDYRHEMPMDDGHHYPQGAMGGQTYYPIEAMGRFNGYWGMPQEDYGYSDMRGRRDYGYDYGDYNDYGDYGETLSDKELEHWEKKLLGSLDERERQMFRKDTIMQKTNSMGKQMDGFGEKEMYVATLMIYTDYKNTIGQNPDLAMKLAYDWLADKDVAVKGAEKLAVYYDCIVEGGDE